MTHFEDMFSTTQVWFANCMTLILTLIAAVLVTSFISGILGMAGGMILMGVLGLTLTVPAAMIVHGIAQMAANAFRFFSLRQQVYWKSVGGYILGSLLTAVLFRFLSFVPPKSVLFIVMGFLPFFFYIPGLKNLDFQKQKHAFICGIGVTAAQLTAGVGGPTLDIFFVRTKLNRFEILATKALTQTLSHLLKITYFMSFLGQANEEVPFQWFPLLILAAYVGTQFGLGIVKKLTDIQFQTLTRRVLIVIGIVYIAKGVSLLF